MWDEISDQDQSSPVEEMASTDELISDTEETLQDSPLQNILGKPPPPDLLHIGRRTQGSNINTTPRHPYYRNFKERSSTTTTEETNAGLHENSSYRPSYTGH
jgi:hypothetical protein